MKLYALIVIREYNDHENYDSMSWNDEQLVGLFYTRESAENARRSLFKDIIKDDKRFRDRVWGKEYVIAECSSTNEGHPLIEWRDDVHNEEFTLICTIEEHETGRLFNIEAL